MNIFLIPYMAIMAGWAGGSLKGHDRMPSWLPEILFAVPFMLVLYPHIGVWSLVAFLWSYMWMQTGHHDALDMGREVGTRPERDNTLTPVALWIATKLGFKRDSKGYDWIFMAVKGFLISLPVGGLGLILWPLGYELGKIINKGHVWSELLSGGGIGLNLFLFSVVV